MPASRRSLAEVAAAAPTLRGSEAGHFCSLFFLDDVVCLLFVVSTAVCRKYGRLNDIDQDLVPKHVINPSTPSGGTYMPEVKNTSNFRGDRWQAHGIHHYGAKRLNLSSESRHRIPCSSPSQDRTLPDFLSLHRRHLNMHPAWIATIQAVFPSRSSSVLCQQVLVGRSVLTSRHSWTLPTHTHTHTCTVNAL